MPQSWSVEDIPAQSGRVAIVTGANSGLGLETSVALAGAGARVIMACRNPVKADAALQTVRSRIADADVSLMRLDLASLTSIRDFAHQFLSEHDQLDLLINNAGVMAIPLGRTEDGFEMQIGTNHLGHFALTGLLMNTLQETTGARVVNVASLAHRWTRGLDMDDLNFEDRGYNKWDAYGKSKLANLLFTLELQRRLDSKSCGVLAAAAHPGYAATNLQFVGPEQEGSKFAAGFMKIGNALMGQPASSGALPSLYAATADDISNGDYIGPGGFQQLRGSPRKVGRSKAARDEAAAKQLWALSEQLTGIPYL